MSRKNKANENNDANRAKLVAERLALQAVVKVQDTDDAQKTQVQDTNTVNTTLAQDTLNHKVATFAVSDKIRFFCMKCHKAVDAQIAEVYTTREGHKRAKGLCPEGHKITRGHLDIQPKDKTQ